MQAVRCRGVTIELLKTHQSWVDCTPESECLVYRVDITRVKDAEADIVDICAKPLSVCLLMSEQVEVLKRQWTIVAHIDECAYDKTVGFWQDFLAKQFEKYKVKVSPLIRRDEQRRRDAEQVKAMRAAERAHQERLEREALNREFE